MPNPAHLEQLMRQLAEIHLAEQVAQYHRQVTLAGRDRPETRQALEKLEEARELCEVLKAPERAA